MQKSSRDLAVIFTILVALCVYPALLSAHLKLERSNPAANATLDAAPAQLQLWFSEEPLLLMRHVLRDGLRVTGTGVVLGLVLAAGAGRLLSTQLYQVRGSDPIVIAGTAGMVIVVAVVACLLPAWRASRFNLTTALRD